MVGVLTTATGRAVGATVRAVVGDAAGVSVGAGVAVSSGVEVRVGRGVNVGRGVRVGVELPSAIRFPTSHAKMARKAMTVTRKKKTRLILKVELLSEDHERLYYRPNDLANFWV